jgi:tetratricopeptide (TPR) repeat protein/uncharacterized protein YoxC
MPEENFTRRGNSDWSEKRNVEASRRVKDFIRLAALLNGASDHTEQAYSVAHSPERQSRLSREDSIQRYIDYFNKLEPKIGSYLKLLEHTEADNYSKQYEEIKERFESALKDARDGKNSFVHRYAKFSSAYHYKRVEGEKSLSNGINDLCDLYEALVKKSQQREQQEGVRDLNRKIEKVVEELHQLIVPSKEFGVDRWTKKEIEEIEKEIEELHQLIVPSQGSGVDQWIEKEMEELHQLIIPSQESGVDQLAMPEQKRSDENSLAAFPQDIAKMQQMINKYQEECNAYKLELERVKKNSSLVREKWEQDKKKIEEKYKKVFKESEQVLVDYNKLQNDPQKYKEVLEECDRKVKNMLKKLEKVEKDMHGVAKERQSTIYSLRKECIKPVWNMMKNIRDFKLINHPRIFTDQSAKEGQLKSWESLSKKEDLRYLRAKIREASVKPIDKIDAQWFKLYKNLQKERNICLSAYNSDIKSVLSSADKLLEKFLKFQESLNNRYLPELRGKAKKLVNDIIQCFTDALSLTSEKCELDTSFKLENDLKDQIPSGYNPYYSGEHGIAIGDIDSTVLGPCAVKTTRRGLSKFGIDIKEDATEKKIVELVKNDVINGGTPAYEIQKAYQHYGFDYKYYEDKVVTIDDIQRITEQGHVIDVCVSKPGHAHSLLIEGIKKTKNGHNVVLYDPYENRIMKVSYQELKKVLDGRCTLPSEGQMEIRDPLLKAKAVMKILKCKDLASMNIDHIMDNCKNLPRKDRIQCYAYCFDKLKRQIQQSEGDLKLSKQYKDIKGSINLALKKARIGKNSLVHRYAIFSSIYHNERENGERELIGLLKTLGTWQDQKQAPKQKVLLSEKQASPKLIEDLNRREENFKDLIDNIIDDETRQKIINIYYDYGEYNMRKGRYEEVRDNFTRVIALDEGYSGAFAYRGTAYLGLGQLDKALEDLNHACEMDKKNPYALKHRGVVHRKKGQYKEAWADFTQVLALGYSEPWIEDELDKLRPLMRGHQR